MHSEVGGGGGGGARTIKKNGNWAGEVGGQRDAAQHIPVDGHCVTSPRGRMRGSWQRGSAISAQRNGRGLWAACHHICMNFTSML